MVICQNLGMCDGDTGCKYCAELDLLHGCVTMTAAWERRALDAEANLLKAVELLRNAPQVVSAKDHVVTTWWARRAAFLASIDGARATMEQEDSTSE